MILIDKHLQIFSQYLQLETIDIMPAIIILKYCCSCAHIIHNRGRQAWSQK